MQQLNLLEAIHKDREKDIDKIKAKIRMYLYDCVDLGTNCKGTTLTHR